MISFARILQLNPFLRCNATIQRNALLENPLQLHFYWHTYRWGEELHDEGQHQLLILTDDLLPVLRRWPVWKEGEGQVKGMLLQGAQHQVV